MKGQDWQKDGRWYDDYAMLDVLGAAYPDAAIDVAFERVVSMTYARLQKLVAKYHDNSWIKYGALADDYPNCLVFAGQCCSDVQRGTIKERMQGMAAFGRLALTRNDQFWDAAKTKPKRHEICFAHTADQGLVFYEPETEVWLAAPPSYVGSVDELEIK